MISSYINAEIFNMSPFPHHKTSYEKKCSLTKPCSSIKVTHIPGFITIKTYANVAVSPMGIRRKHFHGFCTDTGSKSLKEIKTEAAVKERLQAKKRN